MLRLRLTMKYQEITVPFRIPLIRDYKKSRQDNIMTRVCVVDRFKVRYILI